MGTGKRVDDAAPDTSPPPPNKSVVAGGVRTKRLGQITPRRSGAQNPEDAIEDTAVVNPRNATRLVRQHRLDASPLPVAEFVAHDSSPPVREFESRRSVQTQRLRSRRRSTIS